MTDILYLSSMAASCRDLAIRSAEDETSQNLFMLATLYDRQIEAECEKRDREKRRLKAMMKVIPGGK